MKTGYQIINGFQVTQHRRDAELMNILVTGPPPSRGGGGEFGLW